MEGITEIRLTKLAESLHKIIKIEAAKRGLSMRAFILKAIDREIKAGK